MGDKTEARRLMAAAGVPVVPGAMRQRPMPSRPSGWLARSDIRSCSRRRRAAEASAWRGWTRPGGCPRRLPWRPGAPRHVEVQVFGDGAGTVVHLHERDCSIQRRRHQKLIEESPAPNLAPTIKDGLARAAVAGARAIDYVNARTMEFRVDTAGGFYFLEMNTPLQGEPPVTEEAHGAAPALRQRPVAPGQRRPRRHR